MTHRADPHQLVGTRIASRYLVDALVDETSLSIVYRATHLAWRRRVAIKVFKGASGLSEAARSDLLASFVREGALLAELSETCSAVCQARDFGSLTTKDGSWMPYLVLEWLEGSSLDDVLSKDRASGAAPKTVQQATTTLAPIAKALACAHARGIVHCDVKPGNIMLLHGALEGETRCKLLDFGIARVARDGSTEPASVVHRAFTPGYAAPEQFDPTYGATGPWTDIYALALVVVEMVCGRAALVGDEVGVLGLLSCDPKLRPSPRAFGVDVGEEAESVLQRALALRPEERFQDMRTFWDALSRAARSVAVRSKRNLSSMEATMPFDLRRVRPVPARRAHRRSPWQAFAVAAIAVGLAVGAGSATPYGTRPDSEPPTRGNASAGATRYATLADQLAHGTRTVSAASSASLARVGQLARSLLLPSPSSDAEENRRLAPGTRH